MEESRLESELEVKEVFKDEAVLYPKYIPPVIIGREQHLAILQRYLVDKLRKGVPPRHHILYGSSGTGKTLCITKMLDKIRGDGNCIVEVKAIDPPHTVMKNIAHKLGSESLSKDTDYHWQYIQDVIEQSGKQAIIVLDEVDVMLRMAKKTTGSYDVIYNFTRHPDISLVCVTNTNTKVIDELITNARVRSSFFYDRKDIFFDRYNVDELRAILKDRAKAAFYDGVVSDSENEVVINLCAALSDGIGDARYALDLLRTAADRCVDRSDTRVTEDDVRAAADEIELILLEKDLQRLKPAQHLLLYCALTLGDETTAPEIYQMYTEVL